MLGRTELLLKLKKIEMSYIKKAGAIFYKLNKDMNFDELSEEEIDVFLIFYKFVENMFAFIKLEVNFDVTKPENWSPDSKEKNSDTGSEEEDELEENSPKAQFEEILELSEENLSSNEFCFIQEMSEAEKKLYLENIKKNKNKQKLDKILDPEKILEKKLDSLEIEDEETPKILLIKPVTKHSISTKFFKKKRQKKEINFIKEKNLNELSNNNEEVEEVEDSLEEIPTDIEESLNEPASKAIFTNESNRNSQKIPKHNFDKNTKEKYLEENDLIEIDQKMNKIKFEVKKLKLLSQKMYLEEAEVELNESAIPKKERLVYFTKEKNLKKNQQNLEVIKEKEKPKQSDLNCTNIKEFKENFNSSIRSSNNINQEKFDQTQNKPKKKFYCQKEKSKSKEKKK